MIRDGTWAFTHADGIPAAWDMSLVMLILLQGVNEGMLAKLSYSEECRCLAACQTCTLWCMAGGILDELIPELCILLQAVPLFSNVS